MSKVYHYFKQVLFYSFLVAYILLLANSLLFKEVSLVGLFSADRVISRTINLIPFKTIVEYVHFNIWISLMNVAGNIVLFIPLGIYLPIFKTNKKILNSIIIICAVSLSVEIIQYILGIGSTDIDDLILNMLGGLLGIFIYKVLYFWLKDKSKVKTAVTFLFCLVSACLGIFLIIVKLSGYMIKIF